MSEVSRVAGLSLGVALLQSAVIMHRDLQAFLAARSSGKDEEVR